MATVMRTEVVPKTLRWVGTREIRPDGVDKVTGRARFGADLNLPGMLVGRVLRSPYPHAIIKSIDTSKAAALPGVKAIVTRTDDSLSEQAVMEYCRKNLAGYKCPTSVDWIETIPRNPSGKILKVELRKPYWSGQDRQVS